MRIKLFAAGAVIAFAAGIGSASAGMVMCGFRCLIVWLERSVLRLSRAVVVVEEWEVLAQLVDELVGVDGLAHDDETVDQ